MPKPLTIVATIIASPGHEDLVERELIKAIAPTLAEAGCLQYDLHQDHNQPGLFLFFENWATREEWLVHMESDHLAEMKQATEGKIESTVINEMTQIVG